MTASHPPTLSRFGKPSAAWFEMKDFFYTRDQELAGHARRIASIYARQPPRVYCKICSHNLPRHPDFEKNDVGYVVCGSCGHFNGLQLDTDAFNRAVYVEESSAIYQIAYASADRESYEKRVREIYAPKAQFLAEALDANGCPSRGVRVADFGSGAGYFVAGLRQAGFSSEGYEVSSELVSVASRMIGEGALTHIEMTDIDGVIASIDARVLSFIFVLEHVGDPLTLLRAAAANPAVEYVYFSVPMFSASVFFETAFPQYYHRHLSAGHTHLFTETSLCWIEDNLGFHRAAEWWFGLDMVDLVRILGVHFAAHTATAGAARLWNEMMKSAVDQLQLQLDQRRLASEVHMLWRVKQ